jgi:sterol desaturase/sphingolipid hydroxylase (fatty acid hydroxylase superfamily)
MFETLDLYLSNFWTYFYDNFPEDYTLIYIPYATLFSSYFLFGFFMYFIDAFEIPFFKKYKLQKNVKTSSSTLFKCLKSLVISYFFVVFPSYYFSFKLLISHLGFQFTRDLPKFPTFFLQIVIFLIIEDFCHYWLHRFFHLQFIYPLVHYKHHEFTSPTPLATNYAHPVEIAVLGFCSLAGPIIFRPHIFVFLVWMHIRYL